MRRITVAAAVLATGLATVLAGCGAEDSPSAAGPASPSGPATTTTATASPTESPAEEPTEEPTGGESLEPAPAEGEVAGAGFTLTLPEGWIEISTEQLADLERLAGDDPEAQAALRTAVQAARAAGVKAIYGSRESMESSPTQFLTNVNVIRQPGRGFPRDPAQGFRIIRPQLEAAGLLQVKRAPLLRGAAVGDALAVTYRLPGVAGMGEQHYLLQGDDVFIVSLTTDQPGRYLPELREIAASVRAR